MSKHDRNVMRGLAAILSAQQVILACVFRGDFPEGMQESILRSAESCGAIAEMLTGDGDEQTTDNG